MFPVTATSSHTPSASPFPADRMVKVELEAAEALACLAHSSVIIETRATTEFCSSGTGNSVSGQVQKESPAEEESHAVESVQFFSDLAEDRVHVVHKHGKKICNMMTKPIEEQQDTELQSKPVVKTTYAPSVGSKSRQKLNEAEKEARRVRRVLANRESARQTIRRRQVLYEELTREVADLAWENENLKKEKELAMKEYDSLKSTNESLKVQMTKVVKVEVEETREDLTLSHAETPTSPSTSYPVYVFNQPPLFPFLWPSIIPPSNLVQLHCVPQNGIPIPSQVPVPSSDKHYSFPEYENPTRTNVPGTPLYVLPCPWLFPLTHHANGVHPQSFDSHDKQKEILINNQSSGSSTAKSIALVESHHVFPPIEIKNEATNSVQPVPASTLHENPSIISLDGDGRGVGPQSRGVILMPEPLSHIRPAVTIEHENIPRPKHACDLKDVSAAAGDVINGSTEVTQESVVCPSKKLINFAAAAETRKRRKELTKLKNLHYRQFRVSY